MERRWAAAGGRRRPAVPSYAGAPPAGGPRPGGSHRREAESAQPRRCAAWTSRPHWDRECTAPARGRQSGVQSREEVVEQEERAVERQRAAEFDPLLLAA